MTREEAINEIRSWDFLNEKETEAVQTLIPELRDNNDEELEKEIATWIPQHIKGGEEGIWKKAREATTKWGGIVARHFAQWQKEQDDKKLSENIAAAYQLGLADKEKQMMSEAVEGIVTTRSVAGNIVTAHVDYRYKDGQKVRVIVLPKED